MAPNQSSDTLFEEDDELLPPKSESLFNFELPYEDDDDE
jgi:hypothetical protein